MVERPSGLLLLLILCSCAACNLHTLKQNWVTYGGNTHSRQWTRCDLCGILFPSLNMKEIPRIGRTAIYHKPIISSLCFVRRFKTSSVSKHGTCISSPSHSLPSNNVTGSMCTYRGSESTQLLFILISISRLERGLTMNVHEDVYAWWWMFVSVCTLSSLFPPYVYLCVLSSICFRFGMCIRQMYDGLKVSRPNPRVRCNRSMSSYWKDNTNILRD